MRKKKGIVFGLVLAFSTQLAMSQFYPGNLAVLRAGDGAEVLSNSGNPVFLDQFTPDGVLVNTIAVPTNGPQSLIISGKASSEGFISLSQDKHLLTLVGYNTNFTFANSLPDATSAVVPRGIATVDYLGNYNLATNTGTFFSANNVRSGTTDGAANFWGAGAASGTVYLGLEGPPAVVQGANTEVVGIFNGNLCFSSQKTSPIGIYTFAGTPTTAASPTLLFASSGPSSPSPYGFAISPDSNSVYVADDNSIAKHGGIQKYVSTSGTWSLAYTLGTGAASTTGARALAVDFSGPSPIIYATTADSVSNNLIRIVDTGSGSAATVLATSGFDQLFRGVQFIPQGYAPAITTQPQSQTVPAGQSVSFYVTASGTTNLTYQWLFDSNTISSATGPTLTIDSVAATNAGSYQVVITNAWGATTSFVAVLSIGSGIPLPNILTAPQSQTVPATSTVIFSVTASGVISTYQWQENGSNLSDVGNISGSAGPTLTISNALGADDGAYQVILSNASGSVTNPVPAELTVIDPYIESQPVGQTFLAGATAALSVNAVGTQPLFYQWFSNGAPMSLATFDPLEITNLQPIDNGTYSVLVSNAVGSVLSSNALVVVALPQTAFFPQSLVVLRSGDGAQTLASSGNTLFLDQFNTNGSYVGSMSIPDNGTNALLISGVASSEGYMTRSADDKSLVLAGYNTNRGAVTGSLSSTTGIAVPRGIAEIDGNGVYTLAVVSTNLYSAENLRSATTDDGENFWGAGPGDGICYFGLEDPPATVESSFSNCRVIEFVNTNNLAFSTQTKPAGIYVFDSPSPTASAGVSQVIGTGSGSSPEDFAFSPDNTMAYIADDSANGGIQNWQLVASNWSLAYTLPSGVANVGVRGITADFSGAHPTLYAITAEAQANRLIAVTDIGANSTVMTLATAGSNQVFRAVKFAPRVQPIAAAFSNPNLSVNGQFSFGIAGSPGYSYEIDASSNLMDWVPVVTNIAPFVYSTSLSQTFPGQFYRATGLP